MASSIWTNFAFNISLIWINVAILICLFVVHTYRMCNDQKDRNSKIKFCKFITIKHLSYIVLISAFLAQIQQAITYTPSITSISFINDEICEFSGKFGNVCIATSHFALHLFVALRSQIVHKHSSIWYKIGLFMISSDIIYILYIISGIPTYKTIEDGLLCRLSEADPSVFIWFGLNDFVIGSYCLIAFLIPLQKYAYIEDQMEAEATDNIKLRSVVKRVMFWSSTALITTMLITIAAATISGSGGRLFGIDSVINAMCIVFQFSGSGQKAACKLNCCRWNQSENNLVRIMRVNTATETTTNCKIDMDGTSKCDTQIEIDVIDKDSVAPSIKNALSLKKVSSFKNVSKSMSLSLVRADSDPIANVARNCKLKVIHSH